MASKESTVKAIAELDIENAYTWEGSARTYLNKFDENSDTIIVEVHGSSEVEHSGDTAGLGSQVQELEETYVTVYGHTFTIVDTNFSYQNDDEDSNWINVKGTVKIKVS